MFNKMVIPTGGESSTVNYSIDEYNLNGASGTPFEANCTNAFFVVTSAQGNAGGTMYCVGYLDNGTLTYIYDYGTYIQYGSSYNNGHLRLFSGADVTLWLKIMYI